MHVRILAFASLREILSSSDGSLELPEGSRVDDVWPALAARHPGLAPHRESARVARNGRLAPYNEALADGDEIALLPPVGGG